MLHNLILSCSKWIAFSVAIIVLIISILKWRHGYWKRIGLPYVKPTSIFGIIGNPLNRKKHLSYITQDIYLDFKQRGAKHGGMYQLTCPVYLAVHPDIVKTVLQTEFNNFYDRGFYYNEKDDPLSAHVFAISGEKWRKLRTKLSPTFSSGKMKMMFEILLECGVNLLDAMNQKCAIGVDIKDTLARYTTDVIGSCAFGLECNSFVDENAEFRKYGKLVFRSSRWETFKNAFMCTNPNFARMFNLRLLPKELTDFFSNVVKDTIKYREDNNVKRNDMLQILLELPDDVSNDHKQIRSGKALTMNEIAAQAFVFFAAGFETSSTTMTFCLYELAVNPVIQERLRDEINNVLDQHNGEITYDGIMAMNYMGQVIDETLRKYPPLGVSSRMNVVDFPMIDIVLEKGTRIYIPIYSFHHDPDYFPNPDQFDPERFSEENRTKIKPFTYMPFGEGPRTCIGMRFGIMQTRVGLTILLRNFVISLNKKTTSPLIIDPYSFILSAEGGVWLDLEKVQNSK